MENFCGFDFGYVRIYLCMGMNLWEFFCMAMEKNWQLCMDVWKILIVVKFWWGIGCENIYIYIYIMEIFGHVGFGKLFWLCGNGVVNFLGLDV